MNFINTCRSKRKKAEMVDISPDYESPVFTASASPPLPDQPPPLPLKHNPAYGNVSPQELSTTDNEAYGVVC